MIVLLLQISKCMTGMFTANTARRYTGWRRTSTHILQNVAAETMQGLKCQVTVHRKLYYCGLFSYSKPILSAEWEETMIISAQSYAKVARTNTFITPQGRKIEPVNVPGKL